MLSKGHKGRYHLPGGVHAQAEVLRDRKGNRYDLAVEGIPPHDTQMVPLGAAPGTFLPDHFELVPVSAEVPNRLVPLPPDPVVFPPVWPQYAALALSAAATALGLVALLH